MQTIKSRKAKTGEVLYFTPEELVMMVVMSNDEGIRYIEPNNPEIDENGNVVTKYASYETLSEWVISLGTVNNISAMLVGNR